MNVLKRLIIKCDHSVVLSHFHLLIIFANVLTPQPTDNSYFSLLFQYLWRALYIYIYMISIVYINIYIYMYIYIYASHFFTCQYTGDVK